ncbi:protein sorting system archaetidylserine synthase [Halobaculum roseum]|uniref:Protein sorting system archaetidylserine synthase n=1 Tax=Halobaculum roseum TaxID=2175149 RepID=A0ABD5MH00_9EURY|nr:protein sorting system archaetidylserine synthase [Halobaculum roseum]QZY02790.1 protein sorting system archaetidylserine synthase [Halobaculum roseum]
MTDRPRFLSRLGLADAVTAGNAALGTLAAVAAAVDPTLAARLVLLAAVADGLDGVLARRYGGTPVGPHLDSLADVASFGVAPALIVAATVTGSYPLDSAPAVYAAGLVVPAAYVALAVIRLAVYNVEDEGAKTTHGVQTTLAATVIAASVLAGLDSPAVVLGLAAVSAPLMVTPVRYPDLHPQDALVMGVVQACAILLTGMAGESFAFALLFLALGYLVLGPRFYWRDVSESAEDPDDQAGESTEDPGGSTDDPADPGDAAPGTDDHELGA